MHFVGFLATLSRHETGYVIFAFYLIVDTVGSVIVIALFQNYRILGNVFEAMFRMFATSSPETEDVKLLNYLHLISETILIISLPHKWR
ncbi:hypothetical protein HDE_07089 [Halotydeus destructor]|nr:hypothetical protein HDE_07089 [Halotydeus destructor]